MSKEEILQLLKNIYSDNELFDVTDVSTLSNIFTLKDWDGRNRFYKYRLDEENGTIEIYNDFGALKRKKIISDYPSKKEVV